jgi:tripartite ATP-independent transporter DctM subunit
MEQFLVSFLLVTVLLAFLASGIWIGLALMLVGLITMEVFLAKPAGDSMALTIWGSLSSWTLTALPLFIWMGEILYRGRLSEDLFRGLAPWLHRLPGRLLHVNVIGSTIFAAVSGSSAATCATVGRMTIPELRKRNYPEKMTVGTLAGSATLGFLIPPSIIMIVYGVAADVSIAQLFIAGILPGLLLASLFMGYVCAWSLLNPSAIPAAEQSLSLRRKLYEARNLIPILLLIFLVLGSIYTGLATATEAAALGVVGALFLSWWQKTLSWASFREGILAGARLYCMIALILAGSSFLTLAMGFIGLPRNLAAWIGALGLSSLELIIVLTIFYLLLGCFLDGISMVVLTMAVVLPTITQAGIDLLWFGIFIVLVVEMAQVTPPVGFNLFVLQAMTKHQIIFIARAALPFFFILLAAVLIIYFFPEIVTFLPGQMQLRPRKKMPVLPALFFSYSFSRERGFFLARFR